MTAAEVALDVVVGAAAFAMALNAVRWFLWGMVTWIYLSELLAECGEEPGWKPKQPALGMGLWLLVRRPPMVGASERERVDVEGRVAIARAWVWFGAGIATLALLILAQHLWR